MQIRSEAWSDSYEKMISPVAFPILTSHAWFDLKKHSQQLQNRTSVTGDRSTNIHYRNSQNGDKVECTPANQRQTDRFAPKVGGLRTCYVLVLSQIYNWEMPYPRQVEMDFFKCCFIWQMGTDSQRTIWENLGVVFNVNVIQNAAWVPCIGISAIDTQVIPYGTRHFR